MTIIYTIGDATDPNNADGRMILPHIVNRGGAWGAGYVMALSARWSEPERRYRNWAQVSGTSLPLERRRYLPLGAVQYVGVEEGRVTVANMVGQYTPGEGKTPPIDYDALREALADVTQRAVRTGASVHMPRIGAGLAGGYWPTIQAIIDDTLLAAGVEVVVYDLPPREPAVEAVGSVEATPLTFADLFDMGEE